jgi:uroporphyrinogen decarboxylase
MTARERFNNTMEYKPVDRPIFGFWVGAWSETIERWVKEGYDPKKPLIEADPRAWEGGWFFPNPPFERKVIEENNETILYINHEGILMRERKDNPSSSMPQFVKFPVESRDEFRKFWKDRMKPDLEARIGRDYKERLASFRSRDYPLLVIADRWGGFFGPLRNLTGVEKLCMLFYDDPALLEEMLDAFADFIIGMMDKVLQYTDIDMFGFWEDMAYKTGPLVGPELVRKYMLPRYKKVVDFLKSKGVKWICLDSDGDISKLVPIWLDAGINFIYPFESQCGMDVIKFRKEYGKELRMMGGFDKRAVAWGKEAIIKEFDRLEPLVEEGGYILAPDHTFPPDVPYKNYCFFVEEWQKRVFKR